MVSLSLGKAEPHILCKPCFRQKTFRNDLDYFLWQNNLLPTKRCAALSVWRWHFFIIKVLIIAALFKHIPVWQWSASICWYKKKHHGELTSAEGESSSSFKMSQRLTPINTKRTHYSCFKKTFYFAFWKKKRNKNIILMHFLRYYKCEDFARFVKQFLSQVETPISD